MPSTERFGTFYSPWPLLDGKPLNYQWGEIRSNQAETKAIARNSVQELETGVDELNTLRALLGQAYGDLTFRNRFRFYYNKTTQDFCLQKNTGTVDSPTWVDCWCVRLSDGQFQADGTGGIFSAAGFYGPGLENLGEVGESGSTADETFRHVNKLFFNVDDGFELNPISSGANAGSPEVRFTFPFGRAQEFSRSGKEWVIDHNFGYSPVLVQVMDGDKRVVIPDTADLSDPNTAYFYFHGPVSGSVLIATGGVGAVSLIPRDPFYLVMRTSQQPAATHLMHPNADVIFDANFFYVNVDLDEAHGGAHKTARISLINAPGGGSGLGTVTGDNNINASKDITNNISVLLRTKLGGMKGFYMTDGSNIYPGGSLHIESPGGITALAGGNATIQSGSNSILSLYSPGATGDIEILTDSGPVNVQPGGAFNVVAGRDISLKGAGSVDGVIIGKDGMTVADKVRAEAFYLNSGGNIYSQGDGKIHIMTIDNAFDTVVIDQYQLLVSDNSPATPAIASIYDTNTGISWNDDDSMTLSAGGVYQMIVGRDGVLIKDKMEANAFYIGGGSLNIYQLAHTGFGDDGMVNFDMPVGANFNVNKSTVPGTVDSGDYRTQMSIGRSGVLVEDKVVAAGFYLKDGTALGAGGVTAHSALTGLTAPADDHTQYFHVDGRRAVTKIRSGGFYLTPGGSLPGADLSIMSIPIDIAAPIVTNYWLDSWVPQGYIIDNVKLACVSGDCAVGFYIQPNITSLNPHGTAIVGTVGRSEWGTGWGEFYVVPAIRSGIATSQNVMQQDYSLIMSVFVNNNAQHIRGRLVVKLSG